MTVYYPFLNVLFGSGCLVWASFYDWGPHKIRQMVRWIYPMLYAFATNALFFDSVLEVLKLAVMCYVVTSYDARFYQHFGCGGSLS